jgi:hypothetical protein
LGEKELSAIFLSFLMVLTPLANAYVFGSFMQQPKVFTQSFAKTVEVEGKKFELQCLSRLTQYPNGTELFEGSVTIENVSKHIPWLRVNLTKVVTPEELSLWKGETKISDLSSTYSNNGFAPAGQWDNIIFEKKTWDDIVFVVSSPQIWIKYPHDDNYQLYHPCNFNEHWEFPPHVFYNGTQHHNEKFHTHLSIDEVYGWYTGNLSDEEIMRRNVKWGQMGINIIGIGLAALITFELGSSVLGIILDAVVAAMVVLLNWLLETFGISNKSQWIQNVVMAEQGDGFYWTWGFHTKSVYAKIYDPGIPDIGPGLDWHIIQEYSQWFSEYHRIGVWIQPTREFYRTWGKDREASPEIWTVELPPIELGYIPAGIFADYGSLSK